MKDDENFSDDFQEHLRIENEILRIKLKAQFGDAFMMESNDGLPPEIENQFLKQMMAFEDEYADMEYTTVYERIGRPATISPDNLDETELKVALHNLLLLLDKNDITLHINDGPYADEVIYRFIIEELFQKEIEKKPIAGMGVNYIYEEFCPNHEADLLKRTHTFLQHWFAKGFDEYCTEISWHCIREDGARFTREDVIGKMNIFFEAFTGFINDGYNIDRTSFELHDNGKGMGFAEGMLTYSAVMENGELIHYKGPYKLYMQLEDSWWDIFYFVIPGFKW